MAKHGRNDTLVVLASRLWTSNTYQEFLSPIVASHKRTIEWIDASELNAIQLVSSLERVDGVLLTGGADIHPAWYHQPQDTVVCGTIEPSRDSLESFLLNWLDQSHTPCLGICRGMQFMNVHGGGSCTRISLRFLAPMHIEQATRKITGTQPMSLWPSSQSLE